MFKRRTTCEENRNEERQLNYFCIWRQMSEMYLATSMRVWPRAIDHLLWILSYPIKMLAMCAEAMMVITDDIQSGSRVVSRTWDSVYRPGLHYQQGAKVPTLESSKFLRWGTRRVGEWGHAQRKTHFVYDHDFVWEIAGLIGNIVAQSVPPTYPDKFVLSSKRGY